MVVNIGSFTSEEKDISKTLLTKKEEKAVLRLDAVEAVSDCPGRPEGAASWAVLGSGESR